MKLQRIKNTENQVAVKVIDGPETVEQCINDLELVQNKYGEYVGLKIKLL